MEVVVADADVPPVCGVVALGQREGQQEQQGWVGEEEQAAEKR